MSKSAKVVLGRALGYAIHARDPTGSESIQNAVTLSSLEIKVTGVSTAAVSAAPAASQYWLLSALPHRA